ncbi:MAG: Uma2 family endonuclease [Tepidisphaeraceae bacterium]
MSTMSHLLTADDLWNLPGDGRRELVKGEVRTMAPAGFDHGAVIMNLSVPLATYVKAHRLGVVTGAETGFKLSSNPDTVRGADIAFVAASRIPATGRPVKFWQGAPDLAVEVVSPDDTMAEVEEKVDDYLNAGARLVWVVNPRRRTITVHRPGIEPVLLRQSDTLDGQDVVPGFSCRVAEVFV